jgi:hypothetical protein
MLMTAHGMLSGITRVPELQLAQAESDELAKALSTVNKYYGVEASDKTIALLNLALVGGMIYGTRFVAIRERRSQARAARRGNVRPASGLSAEQPMPSPVADPPAAEPVIAGDAPDGFIPGFPGY